MSSDKPATETAVLEALWGAGTGAATDFESATRDRFVEPDREAPGLRLVDWELVADETGEAYFGNAFRSDCGAEVISEDVWVRKQFLLEDPRAREAVLCLSGGVHGPGDPHLVVTVNGNEFEFTTSREEDPGIKYQLDWRRWLNGWLQIPLPVEHLRKGVNNVVIRTSHGCRWSVGLELGCQPNRSAKSFDRGATWQDDRLGTRNALDGEYVIRLALRRHPAKGTITSAPLDLTVETPAAGEELRIGAPVTLGEVQVKTRCDLPEDTALQLRLRVGTTATFSPSTWTPWTPLEEFDAGRAEKSLGGKPGFRYAQWQALLSTANPLVSPVLRQVRCRFDLDRSEPAARGSNSLELRGGNPVIVRGSHPYSYLRPHARVDILRRMIFSGLKKHFGLSRAQVREMLAEGGSQMRLARLISAYVTRTIKHKDPMSDGRLALDAPRDAVLSLHLGRSSSRQARVICDGFANLLNQCCAAMGMPARAFGVGHIMTEVWSNELGAWYVLDSWWPKMYVDPASERPLSAMELQRRLARGEKIVKAWTNLDGEIERREETEVWWPFDRFLIELRNDHTERNRPLQYMDTYSSRAHLVVLDDSLQRLPFTDLQSRRAGDFEWTLNQSRLHAIAIAPGVLEFQVETVTPNLERFEVRLDEKKLRCQRIATFDEETTGRFRLKLASGKHRLSCRTVNAFGVPGIASTAEIESP